jgi:uncharacterized protein (DUF2147 family)
LEIRVTRIRVMTATFGNAIAQIRAFAMHSALQEGNSMLARLFISFACLVMLAPTARAQSTDPSGIWLTQAGDARVRVTRCGGGICGVVVWLREPKDAAGKPQVDDKNPNPSLAKRPMIGLPLFSGMKSTGPGKWNGKIYNADDGKTYASNVSVTGPDTLNVEGCVGSGLCGSESWSRFGR